MAAPAQSFTERLPTEDERATAERLRKIVAAAAVANDGAAVLRFDEERGGEPRSITLTPGMSRLLLDLLRHIADGETVTLVPMGETLTTQQAADILDVSQPFLIKLLERGEIPHTLSGRHRRVRTEDLFEHKRARDARRDQALGDLAEMTGDML